MIRTSVMRRKKNTGVKTGGLYVGAIGEEKEMKA